MDLFTDVTGWNLGTNDRERFVCRAKDTTTYDHDGALTGFGFGKRKSGAMVARIYDKTREAARDGKLWWHDKWGDRWNGDQVFRVEAEFNRQLLREMRTPEDVFANTGALWGYATEQWLTYRSPGSDSNRSRWPVAPEWEAIQHATLRGDAIGFERVAAAEQAANFAKLVPQVRGFLASAGALRGASSLDQTFDRLRLPLARYGVRTGVTFEALLAERRARFGMA